ncbi:uncharacterized protein PG986_013409 [Apiospora aurea]|uniref:Uncharacterized protein n=1 Tax=Apiospora aurea TaxID=335848 RepID=A0ABR1PVG1_9PEZI
MDTFPSPPTVKDGISAAAEADPKWWPEVLVGDRIWVDDVGKLSCDYDELSDALGLPDDYARYARVQRGHAAADEHGHWVARPKPLPSSTIGCHAPPAWLKASSASSSP